MLWVSSAAAWSRVPAHGSTLISVGLGFLAQTYTHGKKSQACMQTNEHTRKDASEHGSMEGKRMCRETQKDGGRSAARWEMAREDAEGGSLLFWQNVA